MNPTSKGNKDSAKAIILSTVGALLGVAVLVSLVYYYYLCRRKKQQKGNLRTCFSFCFFHIYIYSGTKRSEMCMANDTGAMVTVISWLNYRK